MHGNLQYKQCMSVWMQSTYERVDVKIFLKISYFPSSRKYIFIFSLYFLFFHSAVLCHADSSSRNNWILSSYTFLLLVRTRLSCKHYLWVDVWPTLGCVFQWWTVCWILRPCWECTVHRQTTVYHTAVHCFMVSLSLYGLLVLILNEYTITTRRKTTTSFEYIRNLLRNTQST